MPLTARQIHLLAPFFTDAQLIEFFDATAEQINVMFSGNRPVAQPQKILPLLEYLSESTTTLRQLGEMMDAPVGIDEHLVQGLMRRVDELDTSVRLAHGLQNARIEYVWQAAIKTEKELLKTRSFGRKTLNELREILTELGLGLNRSPHDPHVLVALRLTERR